VPRRESCTAAVTAAIRSPRRRWRAARVECEAERLRLKSCSRRGRSHFGRGATTNSGVSVTLALMEFAMKQWTSTPSMVLRAGSSSASLLRVTRGRTVTAIIGIRAAEIEPFRKRAIHTHDLEQTFASPFRAPVTRRSSEPALVTHSGRVAPHNTSARSHACGMVGFAIPRSEGSNPEGKGSDEGQQRGCPPAPKLATGGAFGESGERH
jgi:hypothetical protein